MRKAAAALLFWTASTCAAPCPALAQDDRRARDNARKAPQTDPPWRLHEALGAAKGLRFGLDHRSRFEHLRGDFRSTAKGDATALSMRTLLQAEITSEPLVFGAELEDSRAFASGTTPLNNTIVNPLELLQAYGGLRRSDVLARGDRVGLTLGRFTIDLGSRRLVARNDFRNTINGFTGVDLRWTSPGRHVVRVLAVMPVTRLPSDAAALEDNRVVVDKENTDALLWGVFFASSELPARIQVETYTLGLLERDGTEAPSSNRRLVTPGVRVFRTQRPGAIDFQIESMLQLGISRATTAAADTIDLTHRAFSTHCSAGYRFATSWTPRVALQHDYASGDGDPGDKVNGRFDLLFGARRFELGPTGFYGAFARSNVASPGLRVEATPHRKLDAFVAYRLFWLASARDAWTTAGVRDPRGSSGDLVGRQLEGRLRWHLVPGNLSFEAGAAHLFPGAFLDGAPDSRRSPATFVYTQMTATL